MSVGVNKSRWRGLAEAMERLGNLTGEIDRRLAAGKRVMVLEVGCGNGMALMDLGCLYGERISLNGINKSPDHGQTEATKDIAIKLGRHTADELETAPHPQIYYFDASGPWPLADEAFDIIYSQHAFMWIQDKINALQETNRVLKDGGIALLDLQFKRRGSVYRNSIIVKDGEREIAFWDVAKRFSNIESQQEESTRSILRRMRAWASRLVGLRKFSEGRGRAQWAMKKVPRLDFGLEFCGTKRFGTTLIPGRKGVQSVYRFRRE